MQRSPSSKFQIIFVFFLATILLTGCATLPLPTPSDRIGETGSLGSCAEFFASLDQSIKIAKVIDPGAFRVKKYPYLRVDRFAASFRTEVNNKAAFAAWTDRMQTLDQDARQYEIANLPDSAVAELASVNDRAGLNSKVVACGDLLKVADLQNDENREALGNSVSVPDDYITLRRVLGIYPFTSMFVYSGVSNWHAEARKTYSPEPPLDWQAIRYVPAPKKTDFSSASQIVLSAKRDALGIPMYAAEERETLFQMYAPVWEIQYQGDDDRIGTPYWTDKGALRVNTDEPATYTLLSFTRFGKEILTQLNYIIWFPSRPKKGAFDILGGILDGVNYRVTLDNTGEPLLYETVHNCGCYYKAYPTHRLQVRDKIEYAEPPLILEAPEVNPSMDFMTIAMETRTHLVQHLYPLARKLQPAATAYSLADYGQLRSLHYLEGDRRSMFGQDSIAPGSKRLERFILWPMGVHSPGAMRQWGRHAVAFVGRRHFDDPFYMDRMFVKTGSSRHDEMEKQ